MIFTTLLGSGIAAGFVLLQSTVFQAIAIRGVVPDISMIVLLFVANKNGPMAGQVSGALSGIVADVLSLAPLGFHVFIRTVLGFVFGLSRGNVFLDPILVPILMTAVATFLKGLLTTVLGAVFSLPAAASLLFSSAFFIELGYNSLLAPLIFGVLGLISPLRRFERESRL